MLPAQEPTSHEQGQEQQEPSSREQGQEQQLEPTLHEQGQEQQQEPTMEQTVHNNTDMRGEQTLWNCGYVGT